MTPFTTWLQRKRDDVAAEQPAPLSLQVTIGSLATRLDAAESRIEQIRRLHRPDPTGSWCVACNVGRHGGMDRYGTWRSWM